MNTFKYKDTNERYLTYRGVAYAFIVGKKRLGVRRIDEQTPSEKELDFVVEYILSEGWADHLIGKV